jgi:hypothetical protein
LEALLHLFAYLDEKQHNARIIFDPLYPPIDMTVVKECDWKHFFGDLHEAIPPNAPPPRGKDVNLRMFINSDHAGDHLTTTIVHRLSDLFEYGPDYAACKEANDDRDQHNWHCMEVL